MKLEKWDKNEGYTIVITKDIDICISKHIFENSDDAQILYLVDYFDDNSDWEEGWVGEKYDEFDELYQALEYLEDEFNIPKKITKQIKL